MRGLSKIGIVLSLMAVFVGQLFVLSALGEEKSAPIYSSDFAVMQQGKTFFGNPAATPETKTKETKFYIMKKFSPTDELTLSMVGYEQRSRGLISMGATGQTESYLGVALLDLRFKSFSRTTLRLSFGQELGGAFASGVNLNLMNERLNNESEFKLGFDIGFTYILVPDELTVGILIRDLTEMGATKKKEEKEEEEGQAEEDEDNEEEELIGIGSSLSLEINYCPFKSTSLMLSINRSLGDSGDTEPHIVISLDWEAMRNLFLRGGWTTEGEAISLGLGYKADVYRFDYTISRRGEEELEHTVGITASISY